MGRGFWRFEEKDLKLVSNNGNAAGLLDAGKCSSKISDHKFRERSIYMVADFLQEHSTSGAEVLRR